MLSAEYAEELLPGGGTWPLLLLAALLDSHGIPAAVLTAPAACQYLAGTGAGYPPGPQHAQSAVAGPGTRRARLVGRPGRAVWAGRCRRRPAPRHPRNCSAWRCARRPTRVLETWPKDQPRSGLAAQMRACAASLLRYAGDALWDGGSCHRALLAAGQSLAAARLAGPAVTWWQEVAARCERLLGPRPS